MSDHGVKILVVDDEPRLRESLRELLALQGYKVEVAEGGRVAIERLQECLFDLVLLDLLMPDLDGTQVLDAIRGDSIDTIVIVVSGNSYIRDVIAVQITQRTDGNSEIVSVT